MGGLISAFKNTFGSEEKRILMLGIDGAGKTTILYKIKLNEVITTVPTIGFNVESIKYRNIKFNVWDIGGQDRIRKLWKHYYEGVSGLIYVIDSNDRDRIDENALELGKLLNEEELKKASLLILANKRDLPNIVSIRELKERLGLHYIIDRPWSIQSACGVSGDGIYQGLEWLSNTLKNKHK